MNINKKQQIAMLKSMYGRTDKQYQSYRQKAMNNGVSFERYALYVKYCENNHKYFSSEETKTILSAETLESGITAVGLERIRKANEEERIRKAHEKKAAAFRIELLKLCNRYDVRLLQGDGIDSAITAPYAEDVSWDFDFAVKI